MTTANITALQQMAESLRAMNDDGAAHMAHIIEVGLDDALGLPLGEGQRIFPLSARDQHLLRASLQITLSLIDGTDPDFAPATDLMGRINAVDFDAETTVEDPA